jgi:hypothetical protein
MLPSFFKGWQKELYSERIDGFLTIGKEVSPDMADARMKNAANTQ